EEGPGGPRSAGLRGGCVRGETPDTGTCKAEEVIVKDLTVHDRTVRSQRRGKAEHLVDFVLCRREQAEAAAAGGGITDVQADTAVTGERRARTAPEVQQQSGRVESDRSAVG